MCTLPSKCNVTNPYAVTTEKKTFYTDKRYASDHRTMASINATKHQWMELMPRKTPNFPYAQYGTLPQSNRIQVAAVSSKSQTTLHTHYLLRCISQPHPANKSSPSPSSMSCTA